MPSQMRGTYCGIRRRLRGATALLEPAPGGYRAQFDDLWHRESHHWWYFPASDFSSVHVMGWDLAAEGPLSPAGLTE
jgi:hypothetical protein